MRIGPLKIRREVEGFGDVVYYWSWWSRSSWNGALEEAAAKLEHHAHDIVKAGDQFDQGGDIYSFYKPTMQAAEIVRSLKQ